MPTYWFAGKTIESEIELSLPLSNGSPDFFITVPSDGQINTEGQSRCVFRDDEHVERPISIHRSGDGFVVEFLNLLIARIDHDGRTTELILDNGLELEGASYLISSRLLPLILSLGERLVLHSSSIVHEAVVYAFCGESGYGKSTFALELSKDRAKHFSDDCLILRRDAFGFLACGDGGNPRLWRDSSEHLNLPSRRAATQITQKHSVVQRTLHQQLPLGAIFELVESEDSSFALEELKGNQAYTVVLRSLFRIDPEDPERAKKEFLELSELVEKIAVFRVSVVYDFNRTAELKELVFSKIKELSRVGR